MKRYKVFAIAFCMYLLCIPLLYITYLSHMENHVCSKVECSICVELKEVKYHLEQLRNVIFIVPSMILFLWSIPTFLVNMPVFCIPKKTLITLKVELLN